MASALPIFVFIAFGVLVAVAQIVVGGFISPKRRQAVKDMPYESGMDPFHDTHRRFDVRFHLVAIAFLVFDVEILFLYPWAVASADVASGVGTDGATRAVVFLGAMLFFSLLALGWLYDWRKGVYKWR